MTGNGMAPRNLDRIRGAIAGYPVGKRFTSGEIAVKFGISAREVGATLRWQDNVMKIGRSGKAIQWEKI